MGNIELKDILPNELFQYKGNKYRVICVDNNGEYCCRAINAIHDRWLLPTDIVETIER